MVLGGPCPRKEGQTAVIARAPTNRRCYRWPPVVPHTSSSSDRRPGSHTKNLDRAVFCCSPQFPTQQAGWQRVGLQALPNMPCLQRIRALTSPLRVFFFCVVFLLF